MDDANCRAITDEELAKARRYSMLIQWSEEDEAYIVSVPELPGFHTHGATHSEAVEMGAEAVATWLAGLRHFGHPVPPPRYWSSASTTAVPSAVGTATAR